jgi:hypothetical protein
VGLPFGTRAIIRQPAVQQQQLLNSRPRCRCQQVLVVVVAAAAAVVVGVDSGSTRVGGTVGLPRLHRGSHLGCGSALVPNAVAPPNSQHVGESAGPVPVRGGLDRTRPIPFDEKFDQGEGLADTFYQFLTSV